MIRWMIPAILLIVGVCNAEAGSFLIGLNDDSVEGRLELPIVEDEYGTSNFEGRVLFEEEQDTLLGSVGFSFDGSPGNMQGLEIGAGGRIYGGEADHDQELLGLGFGVKAAYDPGFLGGFGVAAEAFYSPEILSWLDNEHLLETSVRLRFGVTPKVRLFVGYQNIRVKFEDHSTWQIDDSVRLGFEARF